MPMARITRYVQGDDTSNPSSTLAKQDCTFRARKSNVFNAGIFPGPKM